MTLVALAAAPDPASGTRGMVVTPHPAATAAGVRVLERGGNAIDAAIAAAATMTIVEPCSNGLGSDLFCILWDGTQLHGLNASGTAPAAWTPDYHRARQGAGAKAPSKRGWGSVTVPGAVAGWRALHARFGSLPFGDLMAPAIDAAERGYAVPPIVQGKWANAAALPELAVPLQRVLVHRVHRRFCRADCAAAPPSSG